MKPAVRFETVLLAAIPPLMLTVAIPFVNRIEPRVFGFPFLLVWMVFWVAITPIFLLAADKFRRLP